LKHSSPDTPQTVRLCVCVHFLQFLLEIFGECLGFSLCGQGEAGEESKNNVVGLTLAKTGSISMGHHHHLDAYRASIFRLVITQITRNHQDLQAKVESKK